MSDPSPAEVVAELPRLAATHDVPGVSVAIWDGDRATEATTGVINTRTGVPVTADTLFMIQSVTKVVTATLVLQLVDDGLVELDTEVAAVLPGFRTVDPVVSRAVTLRQLLSHTGGFEGDLWGPTTDGDDALERFVADLVPGAAQHSHPGTRFSYSNAGYGLLGRVVEVLRHTTYEEAVRRHLAGPLGIDDLAFSADQALGFRTAIGHVRPTPAEPLRPLRQWAVMPRSNPAAGNQLAMSARGLAAFGRMHLEDGRAGDGSVVLSPESARAMRRRQVDHPAAVGPSSGQGLGWWLREDRVEHGGGAPGVASLLRVSPERRLVAVVLTNADAGHGLAGELLDPLFGEPRSPVRPDTATGPAPATDGLTGRYESRQHTVEISLDADGRPQARITPRNDVLVMARRAGTTASIEQHRLRHREGHVFDLVDDDGGTHGVVEFTDLDDQERGARFLVHGSRALPRTR